MSSDGVNWTAIANSGLTLSSLSGTIQAGVAVTAHTTPAVSSATMDQISPAIPLPASVTTTPLAAPSGVTSYPVQATHNDSGDLVTQTYPTSEVVTTSDTPQEWLVGLTTWQGSTTTTLLGAVIYSGSGGEWLGGAASTTRCGAGSPHGTL